MRGVMGSLQSLFMASVLSVATFPAIAAECKPLGLIASMDLKMLPSGRPGVGVMIGDSSRTMLLDTGAYSSLISAKVVSDLKLTETRNGRSVRTVNGAESNMLARLPTILIGGHLRTNNALYYVMPNNSNEFDGILGGEFLKQFDADFDFAARKLNAFSPDHCEGKVVYWQAPKVAVVPIQLDDGNHVKLRMELEGKRVDAILDTGAADTTLSLTTAQRMFNVNVNDPDVERVGELKGGFTAAVYQRRFKSLAFEGVTINNPMIVLLPDLMTANTTVAKTGSLFREETTSLPTMILGMSLLRQLHVFIAYKERKLYITASAPAPEPQPAQTASASQPEQAPQAQPAQSAQTNNGAFCPSPSTAPVGPAAANPTTTDGMAAFRNRNYPLAYANLWPLADKGNVEAQRDVGIVLRISCGRGNDKSSAVAWLKKAIDSSDAQSAAVLGDMYEFGDGVAKDDAQAFKLLSIGAAGGILPAEADLGELYLSGRGVAQDRYQGIVWSVKAAEKGAPVALIHIGREYANGEALPKDADKAALYVIVGFERLPPGRKAEFQQALDRVTSQLPKNQIEKIQLDAKKWVPSQGALSGVLADAGKQRGH